MKIWLRLLANDLRLSLREPIALLFSFVVPLLFLIGFGEVFGARRHQGQAAFVVNMVLLMGILGNGLFDAGLRLVRDREQDILRRLKVTPLKPRPLILSSLAAGWILCLPSLVVVLVIARVFYGMAIPASPLGLLVVISAGILAFRAVGLMLGSVANSIQEGIILIQLAYVPLLFLTGAMFPLSALPEWMQVIAQFLPATYLVTAMRGVLLMGEGVAANAAALAALVVTTGLGVFLAARLFRWERTDRLPVKAKLWVLVVIAPFLILGISEIGGRHQTAKARALGRVAVRHKATLIRGARIFVGDGRVIEAGTVLVSGGKIQEVRASVEPRPADAKAEVIEAAGATLLPGLIDAHVHLSAPGGLPDERFESGQRWMRRALAAYLYSGVTSVRSGGDPLDHSLDLREELRRDEQYGAELAVCGPMFTAEGGHGTEYLDRLPAVVRGEAEKVMLRLPKTGEEARVSVRELKAAGVDHVKAILESGDPHRPFKRLDAAVFAALADESRAQGLPLMVHTGAAEDVEDALRCGARSVEHGALGKEVSEEVFARLRAKGVTYVPTLAVWEALAQVVRGDAAGLDRPLVAEVGPATLLAATRRALASARTSDAEQRAAYAERFVQAARENLRRAHRAGVELALGTDSGMFTLVQGPAAHRELELWVEAGIPASVALQAATHNGAGLLGVERRLGLVEPGFDANLLLVTGNPVEDVRATSNITMLMLRGEVIRRAALLSTQ